MLPHGKMGRQGRQRGRRGVGLELMSDYNQANSQGLSEGGLEQRQPHFLSVLTD